MARPKKYSLEHALFRWRTLWPRDSKTHRVYAALWVKRWGNRDIRSLTLVELREWKIVRARSVSLATVRVELCVLSGAFKAAKEDGIKVENIVRQLGWDQIHNERQVYFSEAEEAKLHTLLCPDLREYARFAVLTGLRIGEQLAITWPDVRGSKLWVRAQKTERGRWIPLSEEAQAILEARKELPVPFPLAYRQVAAPFTRALGKPASRAGAGTVGGTPSLPAWWPKESRSTRCRACWGIEG